MLQGLGEIRDYPLSDADLRQLLGNDIKILTYPQLKNLSSIDQAFDRKGRSMLLILTNGPTEGHWVCMIKKGDSIEYFDPYGEAPEEQKDELSKSRLRALDQEAPYLTNLFRKSGYKITYNTFPFQKDSKSINTCGRHCAVRLFYAPMSLSKYHSIIGKSGMSPDDFVSALTASDLGK